MFGLVPFAKDLTKGSNDFNNLLDVFDEPFQNIFAPVSAAVKPFKVDVKDKGTAYELTADLPGVNKENISLNYENSYLTIKTTVAKEVSSDTKDDKTAKEPADKYLRRERYSGAMQRSFYIDNVDKDNIKASYKDGVLTVVLPKLTKQQTATQISID